MDSRSRAALISLGILLLEGGGDHRHKIVKYLINLLPKLPQASWPDDLKPIENERIPVAERTIFCIITLMSDIAAEWEDVREEILKSHVDFFQTLTNLLVNFAEDTAVKPQAKKSFLCRSTVPLLIGTIRALGRASKSKPALISRIFPENPVAEPIPSPPVLTKSKSRGGYNSFYSIIPRSLSQIFPKAITTLALTSYDSGAELTLKPTPNTSPEITHDPSVYLFRKYGSSFTQHGPIKLDFEYADEAPFVFKVEQLETILSLAKQILNSSLLDLIDDIAETVFLTNQIKQFPYRSFKEVLTLVIVSLLRELLYPQADLPAPFTKEVQEFVKGLFLSGQTELQSKNQDASEKEERETARPQVNKFKVSESLL